MTTGSDHQIDAKVFERRWLILSVLCLSLVLVVAAVSAVNVAIPAIARELGASNTELLWIVDAYAIVFAGLLLPFGALGDKFGRKGALQLGLAIFAISSVLSAQADNPAQLIAFRAVMGIGAALIMPATLSLLTQVFPAEERGKAIAIWSGFAGAGGALGILMGGILLGHYWWGSVFFVTVPIALLALGLGTWLCPTSKEPGQVLDAGGGVLSIVGFGALLYGIIEGPEKGWTSVHSIGGFVVALIGLGAFLWWERRVAHPMLDLRYFRIPRFGMGSLGVTLAFFAMFSMFYAITLYFQFVRGATALGSAVRLLPFPLVMVLVSPHTAALAERFTPKRVVVFGMASLSIGFVLLSFLTPRTPYVFVAAALFVVALGPSLALAVLSTGIVTSLPLDRSGVASAVNDTTREVGGAVGIAVIGSVLSAGYRGGLGGFVDALPESARSVAEQSVAGGLAIAESLPGAQRLAAVENVRDAFTSAMQSGMLVAAGVVGVAALVLARFYPAGAALISDGGGHGLAQSVMAESDVAGAPARARA